MGIPMISLIWLGLSCFFNGPTPYLIAAGILTGYIFYDISHFAMHIVKKEGFKKKLRYHNRHHFAPVEGNYGVTCGLLDKLFRTELPPLK